jgi:hypothetical protein
MFFVLKYEQILVSIHIHFKCRIIIVQLVLVINIDLVCFSMVHFLVCLYIFIGHACAGTAGYCDVFGKCRAVDAEGPLTRLKNMLLNEENIRTLTEITQVCVYKKF